MASRLGIDVGGTFTDLMFCDDDTGTVIVGKGPTTPGAPNQGVTAVVRSTLSAEQLASVSHFLHGCTVGINALLERKGAVVGLLASAGFRDVLEIRRGDRGAAIYDILWRTPEPLVPRHLRRPVRERIGPDGSVRTPIALEDVEAAAALFAAEGVESVAIAFLHAYANPEHELAAAEALRAAGFAGDISLSHVVSGELGEYERTSTTVVDAYVRPLMSVYLRDLESELGEAGLDGDCLITRSGGGAMFFAEAEARPFETIISGPVAGAAGAAQLCVSRGIARAITADVGGTSFDTCLILDGRPQMKYEGDVLGMPLQSAWVDVRSVGAGGGSLAYADGGLLRVGPQSAGAVPGPVCYRRGGRQPTVTDAAAVLGMLGAGRLAGGLSLDLDAAAQALGALGDELGLAVDEVAAGIIRIANAAMADAIRTVTIEQGEDPRAATMLAFGGAGPLFGALLADELEIVDTLVPPHAGNFSAVGLLGQDVTRSASRTLIRALDAEAIAAIETTAARLFDELAERAGDGDDGAGAADAQRDVALDLRYAGQFHTLTIELPQEGGDASAGADDVARRFAAAYERAFGHTLEAPLEVVTVRATVRSRLAAPLPPHRPSVDGAATATLDAYSFRMGARTSFELLDRGSLTAGAAVAGPLIVTEPTTTTYVDTGFEVEAQADGSMLIRNLEVPR